MGRRQGIAVGPPIARRRRRPGNGHATTFQACSRLASRAPVATAQCMHCNELRMRALIFLLADSQSRAAACHNRQPARLRAPPPPACSPRAPRRVAARAVNRRLPIVCQAVGEVGADHCCRHVGGWSQGECCRMPGGNPGLFQSWRSRGVHHRPHTYDVCLAGRIRTRGQLHYSCHNDSWRGGRDTNDARRHIINNEGAHAADAAVRPSNS